MNGTQFQNVSDAPQSYQKHAVEEFSSTNNIAELQEVDLTTRPTEQAAQVIEEVSQQARTTTNKERRKELLQQRKQMELELERTVPNPPQRPNIISQLFFYWVTPLIRLGRKYVHSRTARR